MNESEKRLQQEIFTLISDEQGINLEEISPEKSLNFDLGVDGEDAVELLLAFSGKFHVDIEPLGGEWDRYFGSEPNLRTVWQGIISFLTGKREPRLPLRISRLVASARTGKWSPLPN